MGGKPEIMWIYIFDKFNDTQNIIQDKIYHDSADKGTILSFK